jgi:hypothetical protein
MPAPNAGVVNTATKTGVVEFVFARLNTTQAANVAANDHIKFDTVIASRGSSVALDTTTAYSSATGAASIGRATLKAGLTYRLRASVPYLLGSGATGFLDVAFFDATLNAQLPGSFQRMLVSTTATNDTGGGFAEAVFSPGQDTLVELRIVNSTAVTSISSSGGVNATLFIETI